MHLQYTDNRDCFDSCCPVPHACAVTQETSCGEFADVAVTTVAAILGEAEAALEAAANFNTITNYTPKPMPTLEVGCGRGLGWRHRNGVRRTRVVADSVNPMYAAMHPPCVGLHSDVLPQIPPELHVCCRRLCNCISPCGMSTAFCCC
jgi:hypothetical protein